MSDEEWNAFWDGYILAQGMRQADQQRQKREQQKKVSRKEAQKVQQDVEKLQRKVQRMQHTTQEDYKIMRQEADRRWSEDRNAVPLARAEEIYQYVMNHRDEVFDFLVGSEERESEAYQTAVRPYLAMKLEDRAEQYCLKKYGKHLYHSRSFADASYKAFVNAYIDECLSR